MAEAPPPPPWRDVLRPLRAPGAGRGPAFGAAVVRLGAERNSAKQAAVWLFLSREVGAEFVDAPPCLFNTLELEGDPRRMVRTLLVLSRGAPLRAFLEPAEGDDPDDPAALPLDLENVGVNLSGAPATDDWLARFALLYLAEPEVAEELLRHMGGDHYAKWFGIDEDDEAFDASEAAFERLAAHAGKMQRHVQARRRSAAKRPSKTMWERYWAGLDTADPWQRLLGLGKLGERLREAPPEWQRRYTARVLEAARGDPDLRCRGVAVSMAGSIGAIGNHAERAQAAALLWATAHGEDPMMAVAALRSLTVFAPRMALLEQEDLVDELLKVADAHTPGPIAPDGPRAAAVHALQDMAKAVPDRKVLAVFAAVGRASLNGVPHVEVEFIERLGARALAVAPVWAADWLAYFFGLGKLELVYPVQRVVASANPPVPPEAAARLVELLGPFTAPRPRYEPPVVRYTALQTVAPLAFAAPAWVAGQLVGNALDYVETQPVFDREPLKDFFNPLSPFITGPHAPRMARYCIDRVNGELGYGSWPPAARARALEWIPFLLPRMDGPSGDRLVRDLRRFAMEADPVTQATAHRVQGMIQAAGPAGIYY